MKNKYMVLDTETGGLIPECSLLTVCFMPLDKKGNPKLTQGGQPKVLNIRLKSDIRGSNGQGYYLVTPEAMAINKIDLAEHDRLAEDRSICEEKIERFLKECSQNFKGIGEDNEAIVEYDKMIPLGQATYGDIVRLKHEFPNVKWEKYFSHGLQDTKSLAYALQEAGKIPPDLKHSLRDLAKYFGVEDNSAHTAEGDCEVTRQVYLKEIELMQSQDGLIELIPFPPEGINLNGF